MGAANTPHSDRFRIEVADDRLSATLHVTAGPRVPAAEVLGRLRELNLYQVGEELIAAAISSELTAPLKMVISKGILPVDERPGKINYLVPLGDFDNGIVAKVQARKILATLSPPIPGKNGRDVFGQPVAYKNNALPIQLGKNVTIKKDTLVAEISGNVRVQDGRLLIEPLLELDGEHDTASPVIIFDGDVSVKGSLREGRTLRVSNSLIVGNAVAAAHLKIGGDAYIKGGMIGKDKGKCVVGSELRCGFITGASVVAGGNVYSQSEILGSRIFCSGRLYVSRGPIIGGEISANGGVECQTIGNTFGVPTTVGAGIDRVTKSLLAVANAEAEANAKSIETMRSKIKPLMDMLKSLTPEQREKVTELLYEADELETKNTSMLSELAKRCELTNQRARAEVQVAEIIYPGVKICLPGLETVITTAIQGPLTISLVQNNSLPEILLFQQTSHLKYALPSKPTGASVAKPANVLKAAA